MFIIDVFFTNLAFIIKYAPVWMIVSFAVLFIAFDILVIPQHIGGMLSAFGRTSAEIKRNHPVAYFLISAECIFLYSLPVIFILVMGNIMNLFV